MNTMSPMATIQNRAKAADTGEFICSSNILFVIEIRW